MKLEEVIGLRSKKLKDDSLSLVIIQTKHLSFNFVNFFDFLNFLSSANNLFFQQFLDHALDVGIRSRQSLRLLGLEHDVLDGLHLGG